jgi:hypothetical protein
MPAPFQGALSFVPVSGGVRAASFFAMTPASREALDHRLMASTPPAKVRAARSGPAQLLKLSS